MASIASTRRFTVRKFGTLNPTAASASTGIAALQVAKKIGAKSIALTRSAGKVPELIAAGAEHVLVVGDSDVLRFHWKLEVGSANQP